MSSRSIFFSFTLLLTRRLVFSAGALQVVLVLAVVVAGFFVVGPLVDPQGHEKLVAEIQTLLLGLLG